MASQNYSYNTPNPYHVPQVDPRDYYAQTEQKAACQNYSNQTNADLNGDYWKSALSGAAQQGQGGLAGLGSGALGKAIPTKSLQDEADRVRSQSDHLDIFLSELHERLFEPLPLKGCGQTLNKDNPSTIEGNLQYATEVLSRAILNLENILAKIGGR